MQHAHIITGDEIAKITVCKGAGTADANDVGQSELMSGVHLPKYTHAYTFAVAHVHSGMDTLARLTLQKLDTFPMEYCRGRDFGDVVGGAFQFRKRNVRSAAV